jgi:hypothetical protein
MLPAQMEHLGRVCIIYRLLIGTDSDTPLCCHVGALLIKLAFSANIPSFSPYIYIASQL